MRNSETKTWKDLRCINNDGEIKKQINRIKTRYQKKNINKAFMLLRFGQGFINDGGIIPSRKSNIFHVIKLIGKIRCIWKNM